jgi:hypothetical protein
MGRSQCRARACSAEPPERPGGGAAFVFCEAHWKQLPAEIQRRVYWGERSSAPFVWDRAVTAAVRYLWLQDSKRRQVSLPWAEGVKG